MTPIKLLLLAASLSALLVGCGANQTTTQPTPEPEKLTVTFTEQKDTLTEQRDTDNPTEFVYPQVTGLQDQALQERINEQIKQKAYEVKTELEPDLLPEDKVLMSYWTSYEKPFLTGDLLSIRFDALYYREGSPYPNNAIKSITLNLRDGKVVTLSDLFTSDSEYRTMLSARVEQEIAKLKDVVLFEPYRGVEEGQGFYLIEEGLVLYYNEYTPHVIGPLAFTIPYAELQDILKPEMAQLVN